jgi:uncharacterized protein YifN (PemK superfamily)
MFKKVALPFVPSPGDILMCDFEGLMPPEMTKIRRVIVLSPRERDSFPDTYLVIPVSKTPPSPPSRCHCEFKARSYGCFDTLESVWAKADMLTCVSKHRLDRVKVHGQYRRMSLRSEDLARVRSAAACAIGIDVAYTTLFTAKVQ